MTLKTLREGKNRSIVEAARAIRRTPFFYEQIEKGERKANYLQKKQLAEFFDISLDVVQEILN